MTTNTVTCDQCNKDITRYAVRLTVNVHRPDGSYMCGVLGPTIYSDGTSFRGGDFCDLECLLANMRETKFAKRESV